MNYFISHLIERKELFTFKVSIQFFSSNLQGGQKDNWHLLLEVGTTLPDNGRTDTGGLLDTHASFWSFGFDGPERDQVKSKLNLPLFSMKSCRTAFSFSSTYSKMTKICIKQELTASKTYWCICT